MATHVFQIENGVMALSPVGASDNSTWQTPAGEGIASVSLADYTSTGFEFSCQVTSGSLTGSPNTTDTTVPPTFCSAEQVTTQVGVTSFTLDATILQDLDVVGVSRWLYKYDTDQAYFFLGFDGTDPPKAVGKVRVIAGTIGGEARNTLTADISLPCVAKPDVWFGDATTSEIVLGVETAATGVTAGIPATLAPSLLAQWANWENLADLIADPVIGAAGSNHPGAAWTTGQKTGLLANQSIAHWNGTTWVVGAA